MEPNAECLTTEKTDTANGLFEVTPYDFCMKLFLCIYPVSSSVEIFGHSWWKEIARVVWAR